MERTFIALKPDAVQRGLIGEIISRIEKRGFKIVAMKLMHLSEEKAKEHYSEHIGKPFFDKLVTFITSGPIVAIVVEGVNVVKTMRKTMGATNPQDSELGSIRADFGQDMGRNIIHGSDSLESAKREIAIFFDDSEILPSWNRDVDKWVIE
ncbi:MAG: nucleoside-diphosphate kinase [bacterium]